MELEYAKHRLRAYCEEVRVVMGSEFPYPHGKSALEQLAQLFSSKLKRLETFSNASDPNVVKQECARSLHALFRYVPLLGFILRSTNVRNAFEVFDPLLRLSRSVLEPGIPENKRKTKLVLSSEWEFSPYTYRGFPELPDFVFIGLPAPESANPLILPLAGHELGHSAWMKNRFADHIRPQLIDLVIRAIASRWPTYQTLFPDLKLTTQADIRTNMFAVQSWNQAVDWASRQAEETFCDFMGLRIFETSYLNAFAYLLAPTTGGRRPVYYPNLLTRVTNLLRAAHEYKINVPSNYTGMFENSLAPAQGPREDFYLDVADKALEGLVAELISLSEQGVRSQKVVTPGSVLHSLAR